MGCREGERKGGGVMGGMKDAALGGREVPNPPWLGGALTASVDLLASLNLYPQ